MTKNKYKKRPGYYKDYYWKHRDVILAGQKRWKEKNKERWLMGARARMKKWYRTPKGIYGNLKDNARKRKQEFPLGQKEFIDWYNYSKKICVYCGITEQQLRFCEHPSGKQRLSIDRINNKNPYTINNLALACMTCNSVKSNYFSYTEMLEIGDKFIWSKSL